MRVWSEPRLFAAASAAKAKRLRLLHFTQVPYSRYDPASSCCDRNSGRWRAADGAGRAADGGAGERSASERARCAYACARRANSGDGGTAAAQAAAAAAAAAADRCGHLRNGRRVRLPRTVRLQYVLSPLLLHVAQLRLDEAEMADRRPLLWFRLCPQRLRDAYRDVAISVDQLAAVIRPRPRP